MQSIRAGDLYFIESPFHCDDVDAEKEKRLSYLVGTISERPAVVIRGPEWWDSFNTVTVIPALRKGNPAITFSLVDRYGRATRAQYPFVPHAVHTIPTARLGRYIGSLGPDEMDELLYAVKWINDPYMRYDQRRYPIPAAYMEVFSQKTPVEDWSDNRLNPVLRVDAEGNLHSETNPELDGFPIDKASRDSITTSALEEFREEGAYVPADTNSQEGIRANGVNVVPVEKTFPPSIFSEDILRRVANRFSLSDAYYVKDAKPRSTDVLTPDERSRIRGSLSEFDFNFVLQYYTKLTVMDAYLLCTRLPTKVLVEITEIPYNCACVLKCLCNVMRDMTDTEYQRRLTADTTDIKEPEPEQEERDDTEYHGLTAEKARKLRPYLNKKSVRKMPDDVARIFLNTPKGIIKGIWKGTAFKSAYPDARKYYQNKLHVR